MNDLLSIDILDASKIASYMRCPRMFLFNYVLGWQQRRPNHHLSFGSAWHSGLEHAWKQYPELTEQTMVDAMNVFSSEFDKLTNIDDAPYWKAKTKDNGRLALAEYATKYLVHDFHNYKPLLVEKSGQIPISTELNLLAVKIDLIVQSLEDGKIYVIEHKTAGQKPVDIYDTRLQIIGYYHALNSAYGPENVGGVIVDVAIFYKPGTPASAKRQAETGTSNGFERYKVTKDGTAMLDGLRTINKWMSEINLAYEKLRETGDPTWFPKCSESCYSYGSVCPFYPICSTGTDPLKMNMPLDYEVREWNPLEEFEKVDTFKAT